MNKFTNAVERFLAIIGVMAAVVSVYIGVLALRNEEFRHELNPFAPTSTPIIVSFITEVPVTVIPATYTPLPTYTPLATYTPNPTVEPERIIEVVTPTTAPTASSSPISSNASNYEESFENVTEGQLPDGWVTSEDLFVTQRGNEKYLTNSDRSRNKQRLSISSSNLNDDFTVGWTISQIQGCDQEVSIGSINVFIGSCSVYDIMIYRLGKTEIQPEGKLLGKVVNYSIERKGSIVTFYANSQDLIKVRIDDIGNPNSVDFSFESEFKLYKVQISK